MTLPIRRHSRALAIPALAYVPLLALLGLQVFEAIRSADRQVGMTIVEAGEGLRVAEVEPGSAAAASGLVAGDRILRFDGSPAIDVDPETLGAVWRRTERARVERPEALQDLDLELVDPEPGREPGLRVRPGRAGLQVTEVAPDGAGEAADLRAGDLIVAVEGSRVVDLSDYAPLAKTFRRGEAVAFRVARDGGIRELRILPGGSPPVAALALNVFIVLLYVVMGLVALAKRPASLPATLLWYLSLVLAFEVALPMDAIGAPTLDLLKDVAYYLVTGIQLGISFHVVSVIPERRPWLVRHPWIVPTYYLVGLVLGGNAALAYLLDAVGRQGVLPWTTDGALMLLDRILVPWTIGLMLILIGPAIRHPTRRGRRQAGLVLVGVAPWATYMVVFEILTRMEVMLPGWIDRFWSVILLPFPFSVFFVLMEAAKVRRRILIGLIDRVQDVGTLEGIEALVRRDLDLAFHVKHSCVFLRDKRSSQLTTTWVGPEGRTQVERIPDGYQVLQRLERAGAALAYPEDFADDLPLEERRWLDRLQASLIVPLVGAHHRLTGLLVLGDKTSEEPFTPDDLELLRALSGQIALACENLGLQLEVEEKEREQQEMLERLQAENVHLVKVCPRCRSCFGSEQKVCPLDGVKLVIPHPVERVIRERYRLEGELGKGGLATVFEAWDLHLERAVAVKVLTRSLVESPDSLRRFQREARLAARLVHPAIVTVHDFGKTETGSPYLVMEKVRGVTLGHLLDRRGTLDPETAADWFDQMLGGLAAAHRAGVVHRDLKPDNVMVSTEKDRAVVKIVDFGLAKIREAGGISATAPGMVLGTLSYMSPEQLKGMEVDERGDIFSVGVMIAECLTGRRPFAGKDPAQVLTSILQDPFDLPGTDPATRRVNHILGRCLDKNREERWESVIELRRHLIGALLDLPGSGAVSDGVATTRPPTEVIEPYDGAS